MIRSFFSRVSKTLHRQRTTHGALLVIDIGTVGMRAAIVAPPNEHRRRALQSAASFPYGKGTVPAGLLTDTAAMETLVRRVMERATRASGAVPQVLRFGGTPPVVWASTTQQRYRRENPDAAVDERELQRMMQKMEWRAVDAVRKEFAQESGQHDTDVTIASARIESVSVDGYTVESPLGFRGQDVVMRIFHTYLPSTHEAALRSLVERLQFREWNVMHEGDAVARILADAGIRDAILVDIGGMTTAVTLVREGSLVQSDSFTFGGRAMTYRIARHLGISSEEAEEIKHRYAEGALSSSVKRNVTVMTANDVKLWMQGISVMVGVFARRHSPLPSRWFLYGEGSRYPKFRSAIAKHVWGEGLPFVQKPTVEDIPTEWFTKRGAPSFSPGAVPLYALGFIDDIAVTPERTALNKELRRTLNIIQD